MSEKAFVKLPRRQAETVIEVLEADLAASDPDELDRDAVASSINRLRGALKRLDDRIEIKYAPTAHRPEESPDE